MSAIRFLFRRIVVGGAAAAPPNVIDPTGLPWQLDLDAASLAALNFGDPINPWPDSSGFGRNAAFNGANPVPLYSDTGTMFGEPPWPGGNQPVAVFQRGIATSLRGAMPAGGIPTTNGYTFYSWYFNTTLQETNTGAIYNGGPGSRPMLLQNTAGFGGAGNFFGFRTSLPTQDLAPTYAENHFGVAWRFAATSLPAGQQFCKAWVRPHNNGEVQLLSTAPHGCLAVTSQYDIGFLFDGFIRRFLFIDTAHDDDTVNGILNWGALNYGVGDVI